MVSRKRKAPQGKAGGAPPMRVDWLSKISEASTPQIPHGWLSTAEIAQASGFSQQQVRRALQRGNTPNVYLPCKQYYWEPEKAVSAIREHAAVRRG